MSPFILQIHTHGLIHMKGKCFDQQWVGSSQLCSLYSLTVLAPAIRQKNPCRKCVDANISTQICDGPGFQNTNIFHQ